MWCVKLCAFLFLTVEGTRGSELTINVRKNASVTLECSSSEDLGMCYCASPFHNCNSCTNVRSLSRPFQLYEDYAEKYFQMSGLEHSNSALYACYKPQTNRLGKRYRLNVFEDRDPTVVVGTVGQSVVISCGTELDTVAALEKQWCRLANAGFCQPDTIVGPENKTNILATHGSFSLMKHELTHNDAGFYRLTQTFQNQTTVCVVELQVKDKPNVLHLSPVRVEPKPDERFEITCQYSQELQEFWKSWLCDHSECPDTVKTVDDRFRSALVLTIDHVACSTIRSFQCVTKTPAGIIYSNIYSRPLDQNPIVDENLFFETERKVVKVKAYSLLNLICKKPIWENYKFHGWNYFDHYDRQPSWCRESRSVCLPVKENVREHMNSVILQICVTPNDDGTTYRCTSSWGNAYVEIIVTAPPPPPPPPQPVTPAVRPIPPRNFITQSPITVVTIVMTSIIIVIIILSVTATRCKGQRLRERCRVRFARRTPLSAVDVHANMYANSVAHYYSHHQQGEGDDKENSSSGSDDEFEEWPLRPKTSPSVMPEDTDYVTVTPGALPRNSEQFGQGGLPLRNHDNMSGLSRKGVVGYTSKTDKVVTKQCEDAAQSNNTEDDDEDEITYTHVIIKPKHSSK